MDEISSVDEYDAEPIPADMLESIRDGSQSRRTIKRIEERYNIHDRIKQMWVEWKVELLSTQNMGKGSQKLFKAVVNELFVSLLITVESGSEVSYFVPEPKKFKSNLIIRIDQEALPEGNLEED